jgi:3-hydroxyisobutyrate dehydrogenase-like beta-hydroxyacid dehydrogenase
MHEHIGFVGLGRMGFPIAKNLVETLPKDACLYLYDIRPERAQDLATWATQRAMTFYQAETQVTELAQVGSPGGIVISMVSDEMALLHIALGEPWVAPAVTTRWNSYLTCS